jgi:heat shock protein HslJ
MNRRKWTLWIALLVLAALAAGCTGAASGSNSSNSASGAANSLANTKWRLMSLGSPGATMPGLETAKITLEFDGQGKAGGNSGCNSYSGGYSVDGDHIRFSEMVSTMMACADNNVMQLEQSYLQALASAGTFAMSNDTLTIHYGQNATLDFVRQ